MARAETVTKLPLDTWAKIMGIHPLHFNQVRIDTDPHCDNIMFQHEWQTADHVSREEIARAIAEAEAKIESQLGYHLCPTWDVDEWHDTIRPKISEFLNFNSSDVRGFNQTVRANWGYMISGGIRSKEVIDAAASIVYSDADSDGYDETATVSVPTTVADKNEIAVYYPGKNGEDSWEIRPIEVSIATGIATIIFRREQAIIASKLDVLDTENAEAIGTVDADFLTTVDVYRKYNDPQSQASFLWEPFTNNCGTCNGDGCANCAYTIQTGCFLIRGDPRQSIVSYKPATWDSDGLVFDTASWSLNRQPDIVRLYYYSGWRNKNQNYVSRMDTEWERTVAYMAAAMLDRPACECSADTWNRWRQDLTLVQGDEDGRPFFREPGSGITGGRGITGNPFGTRRGEVYAWNKVSSLIKATAVRL